MAIQSLDNYVAAAKQIVEFQRSGARTTIANDWFTMLDLAGTPGSGTLAGSSTAAGVVPDDTVNGYPSLSAFGGGNTGYLTRIIFSSTVLARFALFDRLFLAGAYAFNASTTLSAQPSYSARIPNSSYLGTQIWIEAVTAFTGNLSVNINYTNQAGTAGQSTGTFATGGALTVGRCIQIPLAAGDNGVQKIEKVVGTVATVGTFNVMVLRPLWTARVPLANFADLHDLVKTGMPQVFATSALYMLVANDSTTMGINEFSIEIANG